MVRYAIADLHGRLDLFNKVKEYINDDDILYVLGDCNDRGPYPWLTLKTVIDDPQCVLLMGNHEYMLWRAMEAVLQAEREDELVERYMYDAAYANGGPIYLLTINGGFSTLEEWYKEPNKMYYYDVVGGLPLEIALPHKLGRRTIYLNHAGYEPGYADELGVEDKVWDRKHFLYSWCAPKGDIVIGGHTYVDYITDKFDFMGWDYNRPQGMEGHLVYNDGHKIDIDLGAYATGRLCLLNLDTLEGTIIKEDKVAETK